MFQIPCPWPFLLHVSFLGIQQYRASPESKNVSPQVHFAAHLSPQILPINWFNIFLQVIYLCNLISKILPFPLQTVGWGKSIPLRNWTDKARITSVLVLSMFLFIKFGSQRCNFCSLLWYYLGKSDLLISNTIYLGNIICCKYDISLSNITRLNRSKNLCSDKNVYDFFLKIL